MNLLIWKNFERSILQKDFKPVLETQLFIRFGL
jgi:hypothetical protein